MEWSLLKWARIFMRSLLLGELQVTAYQSYGFITQVAHELPRLMNLKVRATNAGEYAPRFLPKSILKNSKFHVIFAEGRIKLEQLRSRGKNHHTISKVQQNPTFESWALQIILWVDGSAQRGPEEPQ